MKRSLARRILSLFLLLFASFAFVACSVVLSPLPDDPNNKTLDKSTTKSAPAKTLKVFNSKPIPDGGSLFQEPKHLTICKKDDDCGNGIPPNGGKQRCVNLFGASTCFFPCDPRKGIGEVQNPDCIKPENCIRLTDGTGLCVYVPGQLYGIGSYGAIVQHKQGDKCLMRFGGCLDRLICIDTKRHGSVGTCQEECNPAPSCSKNDDCPQNQKCTSGYCVQPNPCKTPGTTCKRLASGFGACTTN